MAVMVRMMRPITMTSITAMMNDPAILRWRVVFFFIGFDFLSLFLLLQIGQSVQHLELHTMNRQTAVKVKKESRGEKNMKKRKKTNIQRDPTNQGHLRSDRVANENEKERKKNKKKQKANGIAGRNTTMADAPGPPAAFFLLYRLLFFHVLLVVVVLFFWSSCVTWPDLEWSDQLPTCSRGGGGGLLIGRFRNVVDGPRLLRSLPSCLPILKSDSSRLTWFVVQSYRVLFFLPIICETKEKRIALQGLNRRDRIDERDRAS